MEGEGGAGRWPLSECSSWIRSIWSWVLVLTGARSQEPVKEAALAQLKPFGDDS